MINSQNSSNLNISLSSTGANFNSLDNDWFVAKITNSYRTQVYDSTNVAVSIVLHGWEAQPSVAQSLLFDTTNNITSGRGFVSTTIVNGEPESIVNPAVSLFNTEIGEGTMVYMRLRGANTKYSAIYECITMANFSNGVVTSVQCVNNILVVTYL